MAKDGVGAESMHLRHADPEREAVQLRLSPRDWKRNRSVFQGIKVVGVIGVLPEIISIYYQIVPERLLETSVILVAAPGT